MLPPLFLLFGGDLLVQENTFIPLQVNTSSHSSNPSTDAGMTLLSHVLFPIDVILCQSVYRRKVAKKKHQWLCDITHEQACAGHINEIWRAYIRRERFVRVISKTERPLLSANKVDQIWIEFAAQNTCQSICSGKPD